MLGLSTESLLLSMGGKLIWPPDVFCDVFADLDMQSYKEWKDVCKQCQAEQSYLPPQIIGSGAPYGSRLGIVH